MMETRRDEIWESTRRAHNTIRETTNDIQDIAQNMAYLHPNLSNDLYALAHEIETAQRTIQDNSSRLINLDLKDSQQHMGEIFVALLDRTNKDHDHA